MGGKPAIDGRSRVSDELAAVSNLESIGRRFAPVRPARGRFGSHRNRADGLRAQVPGQRILVSHVLYLPAVLYERGLIPALEWLCDSFEERTGIETRLERSRPVSPMEDEILGLIFRAARELLQNVAKHAQATAAIVLVDQEGGRLRICVADDGIGFMWKGPAKKTAVLSSRERHILQLVAGVALRRASPRDSTSRSGP